MRTDVLRTVVLALALTACATVAGASTVELISRADPPPDTNGTSGQPALSADGRYVAFLSDAPNLAPGQVDDNLFHDVFLHDRVTGTTTLVSHAAGSPNRAARPMGLYYLLDVQISADGRYVAFTSLGTDLVPGVTDTNGWSDVFLWDRVTDTTTLVSHAAGSPNVPANRLSYGVQLSADGNYLAFTSRASDLVDGQSEPGVNSPVDDAFLWERASNTVTLLSRQSGTTARVGNEISSAAGISADGSFVLFTSRASDLLSNVSDTVGSFDVFLYQRSSRTVSLVSRASGTPGSPGTPAGAAGSVLFLGGDVVVPVLSADGRWVAFASRAANLVPGQVDDGSSLDAFLFDRVSGEMRLVSRTSGSPLPSQTTGGIANAYDGLAMSADGRYVAFVSEAANLVPGQVDANQSEDVFVYDRATGTTALASHTRGSATVATPDPVGAGRPRLSADGRFLAFTSEATDLVPGQTDLPATSDVFLYDQSTRGTVLVSRPRGSAITAANDTSTAPVISANGGVVAFVSAATDLGEGQLDPNRFYELFLYRRATAEITSPSRRDPGLPATTPHGPSTLGSLSADGRYAVFLSRAAGLVPGYADEPYGFNEFGDETGTWDAFLRDTVAGTTTLLTPPPVPPFTIVESFAPAISADGRFTAFLSVQYGTSGSETVYRLYLYDRVAGTFTLVNHEPGSATPDGFPVALTLSADGRYLAYECHGCGLVPGHPRPGPNDARLPEVFLYDRVTGMNTLVSHASGSPTARAGDASLAPTISADGRFVVFASYATDLVPGQSDTLGTLDLFAFDRVTGSTALVSHPAGLAATAAGRTSLAVGLSADGRFIAFQSGAAGLVPGQVDTNERPDVFLHDRLAGTTVLVSHAASSPVTAAGVDPAAFQFEDLLSISADGRFLVYDSAATDLVAGSNDGNGVHDVFLYDRLTGTSTLVSHAAGAPLSAGNGWSGDSQISADGSRIAFLSAAIDLTLGLTPGQPVPARSRNLYVRDRSAGTTVLAGRSSSDSFQPDLPISLSPRLSADGRRAAFTSDTPFVAGDTNGDWDVYLWRETGITPLPPCRVLDTRRRAERPVLTSNVQRTVTVHGACGVPATAKQVVVKVTVFNPLGKGNLRFYPGAVTATPSGILRFERGATRTQTFVLPLSTNGTLTVLPFVANKGTVHVAVEVAGYFP